MIPIPVIIVAIIIILGIIIYFSGIKQSIRENYGNMKSISDGINPQFYPTDKICSSPSESLCVTNDSCAQYGIGESCMGPQGDMKCSCESSSVDGQPLSVNNAIIKAGAVCDNNSQCETGFCGSQPGMFSKQCTCPPNHYYSNGKCIAENSKIVKNENASFGLGYNIPPFTSTNEVACSTPGKLCKQSTDCSLGETCNGNGNCVCLLKYTNDVQANLINVGGNCQNSNQCVSTSQCSNGKCLCPAGTEYNYANGRCECADPELVYNEKVGCVRPSNIPRKLCNTKPSFICDSNNKCGTGEYCDPVTRRCICNANIYTNVIKAGGKCESDNQCEYGICDNMDGKLDYKVCKYTPVKMSDIAMKKYAF